MKKVFLIIPLILAACAGSDNGQYHAPVPTPTVDYVENLDVYSAPHRDSFLNQLAMNYRSYAIYNARTSGYSEMGELFAQKAVAAFSGETPFPENLDNWPVDDNEIGFELNTGYNDLIGMLRNDAAEVNPDLAAEAQAKYDCWLSSTASGQIDTATECHARFEAAMTALQNCGGKAVVKTAKVKKPQITIEKNYPETRRLAAMPRAGAAREGVIIVNNVNIPDYLVNPVPAVFSQNIYAQDAGRGEFIEMMAMMREELAAIHARLDIIEGDRMMIKVQQIPLEPKQHVMEEIFEVQFDFDKSVIKPEYKDLISKLATATQENNNIKVSVIGHTDTAGSAAYNYALGGRRADAVAKMLVKYGIPSSQIVAVSAGEKDLKVPTADGVPKAENRRVQVTKETHYTEYPRRAPVAIVEEVVNY